MYIKIFSPISKIEPSTFEQCSNLSEITISLSVTIIGKNAISSCVFLNRINIPSSVVLIDDYAFYDLWIQ